MDPIRLIDHGVRVFAGRLYNHDYLWFSSIEISKVSATLPVIHNYALTYALASFSYGVYLGNTPRYEEDLAGMPLYVTPAIAENIQRTKITYNAIDSLTLRTDLGPNVNTPDLGQRVYIDPMYEAEAKSPSKSGYLFYAFLFENEYTQSFGTMRPQGTFRLGKKGAAVRVRWSEISNPMAYFRQSLTRPKHVVNPLDIEGQVESFDVISLPPHLLFRSVEITNDWFIPSDEGMIHLPKSVRQRMKQ